MKSIYEKTIRGTVYIVENVVSENAKENIKKKIARLILNDESKASNDLTNQPFRANMVAPSEDCRKGGEYE